MFCTVNNTTGWHSLKFHKTLTEMKRGAGFIICIERSMKNNNLFLQQVIYLAGK
jgi:hypothetical protein